MGRGVYHWAIRFPATAYCLNRFGGYRDLYAVCDYRVPYRLHGEGPVSSTFTWRQDWGITYFSRAEQSRMARCE